MKKVFPIIAGIVFVLVVVVFVLGKRSIDFDKCRDEVIAEYVSEEYPYILELSADASKDVKCISYIMIVKDGTAKEEALKTMNSLIRDYNSEAKKYKMFMKGSSENYYGGLYEDYDMYVTIVEESMITTDNYLAYQSIPKAQHIKLKLADTDYAKNHS